MCVLNNTQKEFIEGVGSKDGEKYSRQKRKKELLFAEGFQKHSFLNPLLLKLMIKLLRILWQKDKFPDLLKFSSYQYLSLLKCCFCDFMLNGTKENSILLRLWEWRQKEWKNNNRARNKELEVLLLCSWSQWSNTCHITRKPRKFVNNLCLLETDAAHYFIATALII